MTLAEYLAKRCKANGTKLAEEIRALVSLSGVSKTTIYCRVRGVRVGTVGKAEAISQATGGAVSIEELCDIGRKPR